MMEGLGLPAEKAEAKTTDDDELQNGVVETKMLAEAPK